MTDEPVITINGHLLSNAEAMTLRVALESFSTSLSDDAGDELSAAYIAALNRIRSKLYGAESVVIDS